MGILQARIPESVTIPSSRESSQPRDWTQVTHIAGGFFTLWATRKAQTYCYNIDYFYSFIFNPDFLFQVPVVTM